MAVYEHLQYLVDRCGDRRVGKRGNEMAAEYIEGVLEDAGYRCKRQEFKTPSGIQAPSAATMTVGFLASLLLSGCGKIRRTAGTCLAFFMAACILGENTTLVRPAHRLVPKVTGRNLLARPSGSECPSVLVVAHIDTVNEGAAFNEKRVRFVPAGFKVYASFPALALFLSRPGLKWTGRLFRLAMLAGVAQMVYWQFPGRRNAGANDNGSGVAIALETALRRGGAVSEGAWFLFTDGEEAGITGMCAFLAANRPIVSDTAIINLESLGSGELCYLEREGMLWSFKVPGPLCSLIERYAQTEPGVLRGRDIPSFTTDALAALARGYDAVTLVRLTPDGLIPGWHYKDNLARIDPGLLDETADFVSGLVAFLEQTLGSGSSICDVLK
ncbi:MAG TPA: M28 family peptidase [Candidatus Anoxymicrobiaceae bacterium]